MRICQQVEKEANDANTLCDRYDSYGLIWSGHNPPTVYKNKYRELSSSRRLDKDIIEYECDIQTSNNELKNKNDCTLNKYMWDGNKVKQELKLQLNKIASANKTMSCHVRRSIIIR